MFSNDQALEQVRLYWANHGNAAAAATATGGTTAPPGSAGMATTSSLATPASAAGALPPSGWEAGSVRGTRPRCGTGCGPISDDGLESLSRAAAAMRDGSKRLSQGAHSHHTPRRVAGVNLGGVALRGGNGASSGGSSGGGTDEPSRGRVVTGPAATAMAGSRWGGGAADGDTTNGFLSSDKRPDAQVMAAENLPPHRSAMPEAWDRGGRGVDGAAAAAITGGGDGGQDVVYGSAASQAREVVLATPEVSSWEHGGGADGGGGGRSGKGAPGQTAIAGDAKLKACRLAAGDGPGVPTRHDGHEVRSAALIQKTNAGGGGEANGGVTSRGSLVHALHEIARVSEKVFCVCAS